MTRLIDTPQRLAAAQPDLVWYGTFGDFALAPLDDPENPGGLLGGGALYTAIALQVFTDGRGEKDPLDPGMVDQRGWPGDGFDVDRSRGEAPLGNANWTIRRRLPVGARAARDAQLNAMAALSVLAAQKVIGAYAVTATPMPAENRIQLDCDIKRPDGSPLYRGPFSGFWSLADALRRQAAG